MFSRHSRSSARRVHRTPSPTSSQLVPEEDRVAYRVRRDADDEKNARLEAERDMEDEDFVASQGLYMSSQSTERTDDNDYDKRSTHGSDEDDDDDDKTVNGDSSDSEESLSSRSTSSLSSFQDSADS